MTVGQWIVVLVVFSLGILLMPEGPQLRQVISGILCGVGGALMTYWWPLGWRRW